MSVRRAALLALLLVVMAAILGSSGPAVAAESAIPLQPNEAQTLATAQASVPSGSSISSVSGQTALDASRLPGADTEIEGDLSADAAVGITGLGGGNVISATTPICWAVAAWHRWGTWPYQQKITDTTYWCAVYGSHITFRSSVTTASGTLCGVEWRTNGLIGGGVGRYFTYFTNRASAGFSCQTAIPWITIHTTHHEDLKHTDRGVTTFVGSG
jgi:hypothetical protein